MNVKKYEITLTDEQARVMQKCLEFYFRLMLGQSWDFADEIASANFEIDKQDNQNHERQFTSFIHRRDHIRAIMSAVYSIAYEPTGYLEHKTEDMMIAECMWDAIRVARKESRHNSVMPIGNEPVPDIKVTEDNGEKEL